MSFKEYLLNSRPYTALSPLIDEFNFQADKNYLFDLSYLTSITVTGERSAEFLQGQLSCDIRKVTADRMQQGVMCNLKGRILALLDVINWHHLQLVIPADLLTETKASLMKTSLLSRVQLETSTYRMYGLYVNNQSDLLPENLQLPSECFAVTHTDEQCCYQLSDNFYLILTTKEASSSLSLPFIAVQQMRGSLAWHQLQLQQKQIYIYPETRGLFLPHRLDLHLSGYLSFDKGCYKGQEIIARTHYKAKLKHGLRLFTIHTAEPLLAGKRIFTSSGEIEIGELIDFSPLADGRYLIAASILFEHPDEILFEDSKHPVILLPCNI
ncbi:CAF17-like 4Fe-4S cluster assembly/insertion protein YgfZ [Legionella tunisiensis]|uniref:CAF17-like 4Fe-4S cluster assembly/insertion protein YgfZ n=1 Tax=Legionella tunisiensis TaxID=1034944 RepID=UPI0002F80E7A|nr:folate-binding protein YgfZ [Legionella tunisiensis]